MLYTCSYTSRIFIYILYHIIYLYYDMSIKISTVNKIKKY